MAEIASSPIQQIEQRLTDHALEMMDATGALEPDDLTSLKEWGFHLLRDAVTQAEETVGAENACADRLQREQAAIEAGASMRRWVAEFCGAQPALPPAAGVEAEPGDTTTVFSAFLAAAPRPWLRRGLLGALLWTLGSAVADILVASHVTALMRVDVWGRPAPFDLVTLGLSVATLFVYGVIGQAWERGARRLAEAMYGLLLAFMTAALFPSWGGWFQELLGLDWTPVGLAGSLLVAWVFSCSGVMFLLAKKRLWQWVELWRQRAIAEDGLRKREAVARHRQAAEEAGRFLRAYEQPDQWMQPVDGMLPRILARVRQAVQQRYQAPAMAAEADPGSSAATRRLATRLRAYGAHGLASLARVRRPAVSCLLAGLLLTQAGCGNVPLDDPRTTAPTFALVVDQSQSSPALNTNWVASMFPYIVDEVLRTLPMGARVVTLACGDMRQQQRENTSYLQARTTKLGLTRQQLFAWTHAELVHLAEAGKAAPAPRSELVACLAEAAKLLNPQAARPNTLLMLSDGIEDSDLADCSVKARKPCVLPTPAFRIPANTQVVMYGVGIGVSGSRTAALQAAWKKFLMAAGLAEGSLRLRHT